jgi:hypothetical protein
MPEDDRLQAIKHLLFNLCGAPPCATSGIRMRSSCSRTRSCASSTAAVQFSSNGMSSGRSS